MDNLVQRKTRMSMIPLMLLLLFSFPCVHATLELVFIFHECNNVLGNISSDTDSYYNNRNTLLYNMYSDRKIENGFYNSSYGEGSERVYGIGLCRGDVKPDTCRSCLEKSAVLLTIRCGVQKEAIGWYDLCMLRYSNTSIPQQMLTDYKDIVKCTSANATNKLVFDQTVDKLVERLRITAAEGDSSLKFAEGDAPVQSSNQTLYALLQCVPYLSQQNCTSCLETAMSRISPWCRKGKTSNTGGWYLGRSCSLRYETYLFFEPILNHAPAPAPAPAPHLSQLALAPIKGKSNRSRNIIAIVVPVAAGGVVAVVVVLVLLYNYLGAGRPKRNPVQSEGEGDDEGELDNDIKTDELLQFDFATIKSATNDFSDANKLGQGGFGIVYKGTLPDGQQIAIKRLSINSNQGETEFKNEILLTGKLQHRNLVTLLGFCFARRERLLIYEFVPNKSLDYFIFDPIKRANLNWERRYKIIKGIARGLLYLHEDSRLQVVHRDLKISNILLDEELNPKISDFGMARLFEINQTEANTNTIVGTFGYMAPEYIKHGQFSVKSDVFSFGVMILEIVCGKRNSEIRGKEENAQDLLSFAWENWRGGTGSNIVDPTMKDYAWDEIKRCIQIGLLCVQEDISDRPSMNSVLQMLTSSSISVAEPSEPAFLMRPKTPLPMLMLSGSDQYSEATKSSDSGSQFAQGSSNKPPIPDPYPR